MACSRGHKYASKVPQTLKIASAYLPHARNQVAYTLTPWLYCNWMPKADPQAFMQASFWVLPWKHTKQAFKSRSVVPERKGASE